MTDKEQREAENLKETAAGTKKDWVREYFSIPNLLGYFRLILIPIYLYVYLHAETTDDYYRAAGIMLLSFLSDFFDGKIARGFNMITEFGKILDPVADKLTQGVLAISFSLRYPAMRLVLAVFILKEGFMGVAGLYMMRKGYRMNGAQMYGKVCTAVLDVVMLILLAFPGLTNQKVNILSGICLVFMFYALFRYILMYRDAWRVHVKGKKPVK